MNKKSIFNNLIVAFIAQGISLILSFFISFILPKILSVEQFSYWQLFMFYISYVGFFHFGINDGVYLKYGGLKIKELNKEYVSGQFKILLFIQLIFFFIFFVYILQCQLIFDRKCVLFFTGFYMIIFNLSNYLGYIFQSVNKTRWYSYSMIIDKVFFIICVVGLVVAKFDNYIIYLTLYLFGKILCLAYCMIKAKKIVFVKIRRYDDVFFELKNTISVGIKLTVSAISSMLILGIGRFFIDENWGIEVFGKISFALSLTTFALSFISQVSMVFFPALRTTDKKSQIRIYELMRIFCFFVMPLIYIVMIPMKVILTYWIPSYNDSFQYLSILLPICIFDAKMNMVFNTFFKVLRFEKILLCINVLTLTLSTILCFIATYVLKSYIMVMISMVIAITFRSCLSEIYLGKKLHSLDIQKMIFEIVYALCFIIVSLNYKTITSLFLVLIFYLIQVIIFRHKLKYCIIKHNGN